MKPAIDASRALVVALTAAQTDTLHKLDALAAACSKRMTKAHDDLQENITAMQAQAKQMEDDLRQIRDQALALAAEVRDGNADMASAMAALFAKGHAPAPAPDAETVALARRLAPVERAA